MRRTLYVGGIYKKTKKMEIDGAIAENFIYKLTIPKKIQNQH